MLVDFWTYTCINCIRTLPYLKAWDERYRDKGLVTVGVHTPEFPFERDAGNVEDAIAQNALRYPVAQDNDYATWDAYGNQFWPAKYLIDARGQVRYTHFGEGDYEETEEAIRRLLEEAGRRPPPGLARARAERASPFVTTPESYLGAARAERFVNGSIQPARRRSRRRRVACLTTSSPSRAPGASTMRPPRPCSERACTWPSAHSAPSSCSARAGRATPGACAARRTPFAR